VNDYEIMLLLDAELADERQQEILARTRELIERGGGVFGRHDAWGRRKLAYEINRKSEGSYHLLTFSAEPATLDEVSRVLKITDGVLRHLAVRQPATQLRTRESERAETAPRSEDAPAAASRPSPDASEAAVSADRSEE
jgi:small subunit ribosomal protein S6